MNFFKNLWRIQFAVQEEQLFAECGARWKNFYLSIEKTYFVFVPFFSKPILTRQIILSRTTLKSFYRCRFPFWGEIKPPTPVLLTVHFSAALKALVLGNLFKVFRLDITFAREVCQLGIKMKKIWQSPYSFHYPQLQNAPTNVMANLWNLNILPNTRVSLQLKMDRLKYWSWWLYFSSRREPSCKQPLSFLWFQRVFWVLKSNRKISWQGFFKNRSRTFKVC